MTSELAPFVAAVLKDAVMQDLVAELTSLRVCKRQSETVRITGPNCTPIYAWGHLKENGRNFIREEFREPMWKVRLNKTGTCPLKDSAVEVWLGNVRLCSVKEFADFGVRLAPLDERTGTLTWQCGPRHNVKFMVHAAIIGQTEQSVSFIDNFGLDELDDVGVASFVRHNLGSEHSFLGCDFELLIVKKSICGGLH